MLDTTSFTKVVILDPNITRTDFYVTDSSKRTGLAQGFAEFFKTQRLYSSEIDEWNRILTEGQKPSGDFKTKLMLALAEGILGDDLRTVDEDALTGTCGQLIFKWIRSCFESGEIIY